MTDDPTYFDTFENARDMQPGDFIVVKRPTSAALLQVQSTTLSKFSPDVAYTVIGENAGDFIAAINDDAEVSSQLIDFQTLQVLIPPAPSTVPLWLLEIDNAISFFAPPSFVLISSTTGGLFTDDAETPAAVALVPGPWQPISVKAKKRSASGLTVANLAYIDLGSGDSNGGFLEVAGQQRFTITNSGAATTVVIQVRYEAIGATSSDNTILCSRSFEVAAGANELTYDFAGMVEIGSPTNNRIHVEVTVAHADMTLLADPANGSIGVKTYSLRSPA